MILFEFLLLIFIWFFLLFLGQAGAVDEESFISAFEDVKRVNIFSGRSLTDEINKIRETLSKSSNDWKVRIEAMQTFRALLLAGAANYDEMQSSLRTLDVPFQVWKNPFSFTQLGRNFEFVNEYSTNQGNLDFLATNTRRILNEEKFFSGEEIFSLIFSANPIF